MIENFEQAIAEYAKQMDIPLAQAKQEANELVETQMKEEGCTREFAESTFIEDTDSTSEEELNAIAKQAQTNKVDKPKARSVDAYGKKRNRTKKENPDRANIMGLVSEALQGNVEPFEMAANEENKINFMFNGVSYTITLTAHRLPKGKKGK